MFGVRVRRRARMSAVVMVLAAAVFAAPASAAWTTLGRLGNSVLLACKTPEEGGYGPVWKITLVVANDHTPHSVVGGATVDVRRGGRLVSRTVLNTWAPGQWDVKTTYASRLFNDRLSGIAGWGDGHGHGAGGPFNVPARGVFTC